MVIALAVGSAGFAQEATTTNVNVDKYVEGVVQAYKELDAQVKLGLEGEQCAPAVKIAKITNEFAFAAKTQDEVDKFSNAIKPAVDASSLKFDEVMSLASFCSMSEAD